jgi:hypothetical protein
MLGSPPRLRRETSGLALSSLCPARCAAALLLAACVSNEKPSGAPAAAGARTLRVCPVAAKVDHDVTLTKACSPYLQPRGGIDIVNGATLTIEPGVEMRFFGLDWLEVGAGGEPGRMVAKGTAEEPIVFTFADAAEQTTWLGIWFHSGTLEGSVLSHAIVRHGGGDNRHSRPNLLMGCVTLTGVKPGALSLDAVTVENCVNGGLRISNSHVQLGALSFVDSVQGFVLDPESTGQITQPAVYRGVAHNLIQGGTLASDARWLPQAVPYVVDGDIDVAASLTLAAGTELRFTKSHGMLVGGAQPGSLHAEGTAEAPVKLAAQDQSAPWSGVRLLDHAQSGRLAYTQITDTAGEGGVVVSPQAQKFEIKNSRFSGNTNDVRVGCRAQLVSKDNQYAAGHGLIHEPCPAPNKR